MRTWHIMALAALLDLAVAAALLFVGITGLGAFMLAVAVAGLVFAVVLRARGH
jgi:hypothetical protein